MHKNPNNLFFIKNYFIIYLITVVKINNVESILKLFFTCFMLMHINSELIRFNKIAPLTFFFSAANIKFPVLDFSPGSLNLLFYRCYIFRRYNQLLFFINFLFVGFNKIKFCANCIPVFPGFIVN